MGGASGAEQRVRSAERQTRARRASGGGGPSAGGVWVGRHSCADSSLFSCRFAALPFAGLHRAPVSARLRADDPDRDARQVRPQTGGKKRAKGRVVPHPRRLARKASPRRRQRSCALRARRKVAPARSRDVPPARRAWGGGDEPVLSCLAVRSTRRRLLVRGSGRTDSTPKPVESLARHRCHAPSQHAVPPAERLTDRDVPALAAIRSLERVMLGRNQFTGAGFAALKRALPECDMNTLG
jgi:hypothetical protein